MTFTSPTHCGGSHKTYPDFEAMLIDLKSNTGETYTRFNCFKHSPDQSCFKQALTHLHCRNLACWRHHRRWRRVRASRLTAFLRKSSALLDKSRHAVSTCADRRNCKGQERKRCHGYALRKCWRQSVPEIERQRVGWRARLFGLLLHNEKWRCVSLTNERFWSSAKLRASGQHWRKEARNVATKNEC